MDPEPDSDPGSVIFVSDLQGVNNIFFFSKTFSFLLFEGTFTSVFKGKKS